MKGWMSCFVLVLLLAACGGVPEHSSGTAELFSETKEERLEKIKGLEARALTTGDILDPEIGRALQSEYLEFASVFRTDTLTPEFIFKASEVTLNMGQHHLAAQRFLGLHDGYPNYSRAIEAAYMGAFIYDYYINDRGLAETYYQRIAEAYPEHPLGRESAQRLTTLYITDDKLIEMFKKNAKDN